MQKQKTRDPIRQVPVTSATLRLTKAVSVPELQIIDRSFACAHCKKAFGSARALGGHVSKQHAGMSEVYNQKMKIKNQRVHQRAALKLAKQFFTRFSASSPKKERSLVTQIRNVILKTQKEALRKVERGEQPSNQWYQHLSIELCSGKHGKTQTYNRLLQPQSLI